MKGRKGPPLRPEIFTTAMSAKKRRRANLMRIGAFEGEYINSCGKKEDRFMLEGVRWKLLYNRSIITRRDGKRKAIGVRRDSCWFGERATK